MRRFNARFAVKAEEPGLAYRVLDPDLDLSRTLSFRYARVVAQDNTVRLEGRLIQIPAGPKRRSYAGSHVLVHEHLDGSLAVWYQDQLLAQTTSRGDSAKVRARPSRRRPPKAAWLAPLPLAQPTKTLSPAQPHPWRRWNPDFLKPARTESLTS
jgi:hypothetical protein